MSSSALVLDQLGIDYVEPPPGLKYTPNDVGLSWPAMNDTRELQVRKVTVETILTYYAQCTTHHPVPPTHHPVPPTHCNPTQFTIVTLWANASCGTSSRVPIRSTMSFLILSKSRHPDHWGSWAYQRDSTRYLATYHLVFTTYSLATTAYYFVTTTDYLLPTTYHHTTLLRSTYSSLSSTFFTSERRGQVAHLS